METEKEKETPSSSSMTYYVLGALVLVLVVGGAYMLRPKASKPVQAPPAAEVIVPSPTVPGPITGLACERQWYNPVLGFSKYFLGVEGVDFMTTKKVSCEFSVSVGGKVIATASAESGLTGVTERGGGTFRCDSKVLELAPDVPTMVDVTLKNDRNDTATCTQTFILPKP